MSCNQPPLPHHGQYIKAIRESARNLRQSAQVSITDESIERLLQSPAFIDSFHRVSSSHGLALPLKFTSPLDELNVISILSLLNFSSGYRAPLHAQLGRGAWDSMRAFILSLYLASHQGRNFLSAKGMQSLDEAQVAEYLSVDIHVEEPHETIPGVIVGTLGGPLYKLVKLIAGVLNETGSVLVESGYPDLGAFVLEALREGAKSKSDSEPGKDLDHVLERLVVAIPAFQDMAVVNDQVIYCFKKALFLVHAVNIRFGGMSPPPFPIPDTSDIPIFTDNVIPSILVHLGVLDLTASPSLGSLFPPVTEESVVGLLRPPEVRAQTVKNAKLSPKEGPVVTKEQSYILRAAAIDGCELIVNVARRLDPQRAHVDETTLSWIRNLRLAELDMWLWAVAKDRADYRALARFVDRDTVFF